MAAKDKAAKGAAKASKAAQSAKGNPYLQRLVEDADLRDNLRSAFVSARGAYGRLNNGKAPSAALLKDKKLQQQLRETADALRDAGTALKQGPRKTKRRRKGGGLVFLAIAAVVAIAVSEKGRKTVLDALFGAEEEFDYTSNTAPSAPAPDSVPA